MRMQDRLMNKLPVFILPLAWALSCSANAALYVTVVQGLGGMPEYESRFDEQTKTIIEASQSITDEALVYSFTGEEATRENLIAHFNTAAEQMTDDDRMAIYLIGHGSYDGEQYKFNIPGPDITHLDLAEIMSALPGVRNFLVNTSSTSGAILDSLETEDRIIVTATRNGNERNSTEFGRFFAQSFSSPDADLNKNDSISIQEAFDFAARGVEQFYESEGKLATEHPQLRGDAAAQFNLARLSPVEITGESDLITQLLQQRQDLDNRIEQLQLQRSELSDTEYFQQLQDLVLQSATLTEEIDRLRGAAGGD